MGAWFSFISVVVLILVAWVGVKGMGLYTLFGIIVPYLAVLTFLVGIIYRIVQWANVPVPFRIPTTGGQQKSHSWVKASPLDNPTTTAGVIGRMILEVFAFRSLFRNTRLELRDGPKLDYGSNKWLWLAALAFHYSFLVIFLRHFRFFADPVPGFVTLLESVDGFFEAGIPGLFITDIIVVLALLYLFLRRAAVPQLRYISLASDYFPLFLLLGLTLSGILMRYFVRVDIVSVKELASGLVSFRPTVPEGIGSIFFVHLFLLSVLLAYFPFSKLLHMPGVFFSPTRNLANNSRMVRHINPWDYPVKVHTYEEYEDEFREKMKEVGLPVEKE
ncbi:MAG: sulfate reduction electron transfer complex DsrMKJOP subunit DsrM [Deltaproteobacteria bacterium]|nr:sulfate reduction electron transfer complex DsrMKJOP subunit DsrM [Deltaproteobacteria bacterium]MBW2071029.1 sulfate reduction electron transfer complex DsrMKJOP subunit DsrM [Deltaproteobacteria bacterium]